ncbi:ER-derived vesicles protein ERV14 [Nadsonia fulvescens var. elongata DSM 6958]|uniref:ER-derived vesicles protein ERV14 n=1 Tax=Nadsonia fulvescens var. elongata DSM 6958 TaxID=857566 RepID=A0A1E3PN54_9ASCO|nr:ER-derived vesicles protein ERV14 [Nadsonia fulvescens var. elongata DSM 6958]
MFGNTIDYVLCLLFNFLSLFTNVFFTVMYSDLEQDYINPSDLCTKVNSYMLPEVILHTVTTGMLLLTGSYWILAIQIPMLAYNAKTVFVDKDYQLDPLEVFRKVRDYKIRAFAKLGFYTFMFFVYLYLMITSIVNDDLVAEAQTL